MKKLYVIGDSISMQYGPYLQKMVAGIFEYDRKGGADVRRTGSEDSVNRANGGDSSAVLDFLSEKTRDSAFKPDVLLLNCGLHDIKVMHGSENRQIERDAYKQNLLKITELIARNKIFTIWVRTTPVDNALHMQRKSFKRYDSDVVAYNEIADSVFAKRGYDIIDLYTFTAGLGKGEELFTDGVHFHEQISRLHGAYIAGFLTGISSKI